MSIRVKKKKNNHYWAGHCVQCLWHKDNWRGLGLLKLKHLKGFYASHTNRHVAVALSQIITEATSALASVSGLPVGSDSEHFLAVYATPLFAYPTPKTIRAISRKADFWNAILCRAASVNCLRRALLPMNEAT